MCWVVIYRWGWDENGYWVQLAVYTHQVTQQYNTGGVRSYCKVKINDFASNIIIWKIMQTLGGYCTPTRKQVHMKAIKCIL